MTPPATEALTLDAPTGTVSRDAAEKMLQYLVFHRSLLSETSESSSALLERYLTLVQNLKEGVHIVIPDPVQKATALLFELVLDEEFDPWEIDLARFTQAYLGRVREDGAVNFAIAGRLVYMAWNILYLQSEELLRHRREQEPGPTGVAPLEPVDDGYLGLLDTPEAVDVTTAVLDSSDPPPLLEMVRHPETRPVTLLELVHAFGEAEEGARRAIRIDELRDRLREEQRAPPEVLVHGDIPQTDLEDLWELARAHPVDIPFPLLDVWRPAQGKDRLVALFLAALFLAREKSVLLEQERISESPILLVRTTEERVPVVEKE